MTTLPFGKDAKADLPKPEKRRGFSARDVAAVFIKCEARCARCHEKVKLGAYAIDHIQRLDALGKHELENWQLLCTPCHADKTRVDNFEAKKGARQRGEKGQLARRRKNGPQIKSNRKLQSAGFQKRPEGMKHKWPKRKMSKERVHGN